jgi:hypothetical protein
METNTKLTLRKLKAAEPYSNPGSRYSLLGHGKAAEWGLFDAAGAQRATIYQSGGRHPVWNVRIAPEFNPGGSRSRWSAYTRKDAVDSARAHLETQERISRALAQRNRQL